MKRDVTRTWETRIAPLQKKVGKASGKRAKPKVIRESDQFIVLGSWESQLQGEGTDSSTKPARKH